MGHYNAANVELFGEHLILHERSISDAFATNDFLSSQEYTLRVDTFIKVTILRDALQFNLHKLPKVTIGGKEIQLRPFKYARLKRKFSIEYIYKHIGFVELQELVRKVRFDLEKEVENGDKAQPFSQSYMIGLVADHSNISWEEAKELSVSDFISRLETAVLKIRLIRGDEKVDFLNRKDKQDHLQKEFNEIFGDES